jgi:hypothetical protein
MEHGKLVEIMQIKGLIILQNNRTHWISMLAFSKCVLFEFKALVAKMANDTTTNAIAKNNYEVFYNYEIVLRLTCLFLVLKVVDSLSKLVQGRDIFVCDFVALSIFCQ